MLFKSLLVFFLFLALAAILLAERSRFSNFGRGSPKEHFCEKLFCNRATGLGGSVI